MCHHCAMQSPVQRTYSDSVRFTMIAIACIVAALHLFFGRDYINPDGISYLDIADQFRRGVWPAGALLYWSPLYPLLISLFVRSVEHELLLVHLLNGAIFVATLFAFDRFANVVWSAHRSAASPLLPRPIFFFSAYAFFIWGTLSLVAVEIVTPDLLVALIWFIAAERLVIISGPNATRRSYVILGIVLGLGYWAKAVMLPVAALTLVAILLTGRSRSAVRGAGITAALFAVCSLPLIFLVSVDAGRVSFGEAAKINRAWYVEEIPKWIHWQGDPRHGAALSPTLRVSCKPEAYVFTSPFDRATYAPWYAPAYFHRGLKAAFDWRMQWNAVLRNSQELREILTPAAIALLCFIATLFVGKREILPSAFLLAGLGGAVVGMYLGVHIEARFIGPFVAAAAVALLSGVRLPDSPRRATSLVLLLAGGGGLLIALPINDLLAGRLRGSSAEPVVTAVQRLIQPGDKVAVIGDSFEAYWARAADVRIVAEVPRRALGEFGAASSTVQSAVLDAFRSAGVRLVIVDRRARLKVPAHERLLSEDSIIRFDPSLLAPESPGVVPLEHLPECD